MKKLFLLPFIAFIFSSCATRAEVASLQRQIDELHKGTQDAVNVLGKNQNTLDKNLVAFAKNTQKNFKYVAEYLKTLMRLKEMLENNPGMSMKDADYRKNIREELRLAFTRNKVLGESLYKDGYWAVMGEVYYNDGKYKEALILYNIAIVSLEKLKQGKTAYEFRHSCNWLRCDGVLAFAYMGKAASLVALKKNSEAIKVLKKALREGHLHVLTKVGIKFWEQEEFKPLHNDRRFRRLVIQFRSTK